jgi:hypothetical protein
MTTLATCVPTGLPAWSRVADIGDYGGADDKRASETEGDSPYTVAVYRDLQNMRGSAYTKKSGTVVHAENLALARTIAAVGFRKPEQLRANAVPLTSGERLDYWVKVLGLPTRLNEQRWQLRQRAAAHYHAVVGPTRANVEAAVQELLGDVFVALYVNEGTDLATPPDPTFWPGINPGSSDDNLGGGAWNSIRCHVYVEVMQPSGMTIDEFLNITEVQLFQLLDRMLPAWATFSWFHGDGFELDQDLLDFDSL